MCSALERCMATVRRASPSDQQRRRASKTRGTDGKPTQSLDGSGVTAGDFSCCSVLSVPKLFRTPFHDLLTDRAHIAWLRALPPSRKGTILAEVEHSGFLSESKQEDHESQKTEAATDGVESAPEA